LEDQPRVEEDKNVIPSPLYFADPFHPLIYFYQSVLHPLLAIDDRVCLPKLFENIRGFNLGGQSSMEKEDLLPDHLFISDILCDPCHLYNGD